MKSVKCVRVNILLLVILFGIKLFVFFFLSPFYLVFYCGWVRVIGTNFLWFRLVTVANH